MASSVVAFSVISLVSASRTLVMKLTGGPDFGFCKPVWEDTILVNEQSPTNEPIDAKYAAYLNTRFSSITMCIGSPTGHCVTHNFSCAWDSARQLFSHGYIRDPALDQAGILRAFAPPVGAYRDCPMQNPGFNVQCKDGNKVRWGYCVNCPSQPCQSKDDDDADATIGIGLAGQTTPREMGAGWTNYFAGGANTCKANSMQSKNAWIYVTEPAQLTPLCEPPVLVPTPSRKPVQLGELVMKVGYGSQLGFSSPLWADASLLNEQSPASEVEDAKYASYLNTSFNSIAMCVGSPAANCVNHTFACTWTSARQLFSYGFIRDSSVDQTGILRTFAPPVGAYRNCPMQRPGFNLECKDGNKARWGYCVNCASQPCQSNDNDDADATIGIGLAGQSMCHEMGAGWTNYFASGANTCLPNSMRSKSVWLYVAKAANSSGQGVSCTEWWKGRGGVGVEVVHADQEERGITLMTVVIIFGVAVASCLGGGFGVYIYMKSRAQPPAPISQIGVQPVVGTVVGMPVTDVDAKAVSHDREDNPQLEWNPSQDA